jgi:hypothetical protein
MTQALPYLTTSDEWDGAQAFRTEISTMTEAGYRTSMEVRDFAPSTIDRRLSTV